MVPKKPDKKHEDTGQRKSQATRLVELASMAELFHSPDRETFATFSVKGHRETWPLHSRVFREWLSSRYFEQSHSAPSTGAMQDALNVLHGSARNEGREYKVFVRLAERDGSIYLDLTNDRWEVVEITSRGWRIIANPPVKFRRTRAMLPLPHPSPRGNFDGLRQFLNLGSESNWTLVAGWLLGVLSPWGSYCVLVVQGEQGSAKSTFTQMAVALVDPRKAPLRAEPRDVRDLMIFATNAWCLAFDNLSHLRPWLSDAICRLSTGGGFSTRELYTDSEELILDVKRPVILNGIEELATRPDLLDRTILVYLPAIPDDRRRSEAELWKEFDEAKPGILGGLLDKASEALRNLPRVRLEQMPRMSDAARWITAAEPALGWPVGTFIDVYSRNREAANDLALEASPVAMVIRQFMNSPLWLVGSKDEESDQATERVWKGTAAELLEELAERVADSVKWRREWPKNPRALSNALRRIAPSLRSLGIEMQFAQEGHERRRVISIRAKVPRRETHRADGEGLHKQSHETDGSQTRGKGAGEAVARIPESFSGSIEANNLTEPKQIHDDHDDADWQKELDRWFKENLETDDDPLPDVDLDS